MTQKENLEKKRKSAMRKMILFWFIGHVLISAILFFLIPDLSNESKTFKIVIIGSFLLVMVTISLLVISKGKDEFDLKSVVKRLFEKLEVARKDYSEISKHLEMMDEDLLQTDDWIGLAIYGNSKLEIKKTIVEKLKKAKEKMFELEDKVQIIRKMEYQTFWSYLWSFKWF